MYKLWIIILFTLSLSAEFIPNTTIKNYDINITIAESGEMNVQESIEVIPRKLSENNAVDNPLLRLNIKSMMKSKNSIRYVDRNISDIYILLNGKPVKWEEKIFYNDAPNQIIRLLLHTDYITDFLTKEEKTLLDTQNQYIYTITYRVNKTVTESEKDGFDAMEWKIFKNNSHIAIDHARVNIFFPSNLTQDVMENFDFHYTAKNQDEQTFLWKNKHHFYAEMDNFRTNDLMFKIVFSKGFFPQSSEDNFNLVLDENSKQKDSFAFKWDNFLLYWQIPFFIVYFIFLYYYARSYGSFGAMGSIAVKYEPPRGMSLLQAGVLIDKSADIADFPAAIVELANLGYLKIVKKEDNESVYLQRLYDKKIEDLSDDQRYLLKKILFVDRDIYYFSQEDALGRFSTLNKKLYAWLEEKKYVYENFKKTRRVFLFKALFTSLPILFFSLYLVRDLYGENMMLGSIVITYFLTLVIMMVLEKNNLLISIPLLVGLYFVFGLPFFIINNSYLVFFSTPLLIAPFIYGFILFFYKKIGIYTGKGLKAYRHLLGYKEFITRTEAPKIKFVFKEYPDYLDKSLAYAMLFQKISHPLLPTYKNFMHLDTDKYDYPKVTYWGKVRVENNISLKWFITWLVGVILILLIILYGESF